ncbi:glycosyltransferase family 2 protein [Clostridium sp. SM-530-WT-3G]|uniref:glycosyltransferase family 2 protein n=1 Tax=Clostridium sp. SM-530-WT-3G TaxID=2725303 RepID=UPI00145C3A24|nr:glycosyltransferase family 2 protein [Clostridium sp. SM-530-WT-3G]NME83743.1 glycosyltransferase family 2 protein [Clostridium sp. SM-530-WT-3G]
MNNNIIVTVMVTFFNQLEYIQQCLQSIIEQSVSFKYEIICGDDGSTDGTYEELLKWKSYYPDIISVYQMPRDLNAKYEPIVRVSNNRFNMLKHAKGKYVTFLDGDDYYISSNKLEIQVALLEKNDSAIGCGHPVKMVWDNLNQSDQVIGKISSNRIVIPKDIYWAFIWLHADSFLFKNVYLNNPDGMERIECDFFDDNLITCYFLEHGDVIYTPECMVAYRQFEESSWNNRTELQKAFVNMRVFCASKKIFDKRKDICFVRCIDAWRVFYSNRNTKIEITSGMTSIMEEPFVLRTLKYRNANWVYKVGYVLQYYVPIHCNVLIKIANKLKKLRYKKID